MQIYWTIGGTLIQFELSHRTNLRSETPRSTSNITGYDKNDLTVDINYYKSNYRPQMTNEDK